MRPFWENIAPPSQTHEPHALNSGFLSAQEEILVHVEMMVHGTSKNTSSQLVSNFKEANEKLIIV
jgi:hypothetical protein